MQTVLARSFLVVAVIALAGCVYYPATRTYYEVEATSGTTSPTMCSYPSSRKDSIYRNLGSSELYVTTYYDSSQNVNISVEVSSLKHDIEINPSQLSVKLNNSGRSVRPSSFHVETYTGNSHDKFPIKYWVHLKYPINKDKANKFLLLFGPSAISRSGNAISIMPIPFKKVTKSGLYVFSC